MHLSLLLLLLSFVARERDERRSEGEGDGRRRRLRRRISTSFDLEAAAPTAMTVMRVASCFSSFKMHFFPQEKSKKKVKVHFGRKSESPESIYPYSTKDVTST